MYSGATAAENSIYIILSDSKKYGQVNMLDGHHSDDAILTYKGSKVGRIERRKEVQISNDWITKLRLILKKDFGENETAVTAGMIGNNDTYCELNILCKCNSPIGVANLISEDRFYGLHNKYS